MQMYHTIKSSCLLEIALEFNNLAHVLDVQSVQTLPKTDCCLPLLWKLQMVLCMLKLYITFTASLHWNPGLEINTISSSGILFFFHLLTHCSLHPKSLNHLFPITSYSASGEKFNLRVSNSLTVVLAIDLFAPSVVL